MTAKRKTPAKIGRPSLLTPELAEVICDRLASESAHAIFADPAMPTEQTFYNWLRRDAAFFEQSARARAMKAFKDLDAAEREMAEAVPGDDVSLLREKLQHYRWKASKLLRGVFGDKVALEHSGPGGGPIEQRVVVIPSNGRNDRSLPE